MFKTNIVTMLIFNVLALLFYSCNLADGTKHANTVVVTDLLGRKVAIPDSVTRIVGLRAGALRLITYMAANEMVVGIEEIEKQGRTPYTKSYPELTNIQPIGPSMGGDAELLMKAQPDVIFMSYTTIGDADALQQKTGIPVVAIECPEFATAKDTLFATFKLMGKILHKETRADSLIIAINNSISDLYKRTEGIPETEKPLVYVGGVPYSGAHGINSTQPYFPPFMFINARNAAAEIDKKLISHVKGTYIDKEQLMIWNPDIIFIDESGLSIVRKDLGKGSALYNSLNALNNNKIYTLLPYNNYAINYEMVLANAWYVGKILYPEKFSDIDMTDKIDEISQIFFQKKSLNEIIKNSLAFKNFGKNDF